MGARAWLDVWSSVFAADRALGRHAAIPAIVLATGVLACGDDETDAVQTDPQTSFFVTSDKSTTGNLGGLEGADQRCQGLASAVGLGDRTWSAYLSVERGPDGGPVHARDRIGTGPWTNALGATVAEDLDALHARHGDHEVFIDEKSQKIPGFWPDSPDGAEHDILTGSGTDGTVLTGLTCDDWTSASDEHKAQVGHTDGVDSEGVSRDPHWWWSSVHSSAGCADTQPGGGAGRIYCFAGD